MVVVVETPGSPLPIRACWLSWIAVHGAGQAELAALLGLTGVRETTWAEGADLVDDVAHSGEERFSTVVIPPPINAWTLVIGAWVGLPYLERTAYVTELCRQLSAEFGRAHAYFHSEQNDGEAWLIAEDGRVVRRWIAEYPGLALGEPFGVERRLLDEFGIPGRPEDLDPEDDRASSWGASWGECWAPVVAAESSIDPRQIGPETAAPGVVLVADTPLPDGQSEGMAPS
ncbi:hypothetical protein [Embleya sp. NPDC056538]